MDGAELVFVDVGQGDASILVDAGREIAGIVDCPSYGVDAVRDEIHRLGNPDVALLMVSHWDWDHYGGILELVQEFSPARFYYNLASLRAEANSLGSGKAESVLRRIRSLRPKMGCEALRLNEGVYGSIGSLQWRVLSPNVDEEEASVLDLAGGKNLASSVMEVSWGDFSALIGSDAPWTVWRRLMGAYALFPQVFRSPHHGSMSVEKRKRNGVFRRLLETMQPEIVVNSVGPASKYGHPNIELVAETVDRGSRLMCTRGNAQCHKGMRGAAKCAGTVRIKIANGGQYSVDPDQQVHAGAIERFQNAMCRV